MDLYTTTAYELSRTLTRRYSTSFSLASTLYSPAIRPHIYAIYGMVRIADEIVDTYEGPGRSRTLDAFYDDVILSLDTGYSTNPIVHAFAQTARQFAIGVELIDPFFDSMRSDLTQTSYTRPQFDTYVYGSAEVVGLMCLRVFAPNASDYDALAPNARRLGSAYQKVNFLRDFASDYHDRKRIYFPGVSYDAFDDVTKARLVEEIADEFELAREGIARLPLGARRAVALSYRYYRPLLAKLAAMSADEIKHTRASVPSWQKFSAYVVTAVKGAV